MHALVFRGDYPSAAIWVAVLSRTIPLKLTCSRVVTVRLMCIKLHLYKLVLDL